MKTKKITIDTSTIITSTLYNFPLLVHITSANFPDYDSISDNGDDIRFRDSEGNNIPFQIDSWYNTPADDGVVGLVWVKVPEVEQSSEQYIFMDYDTGLSPASSGSAVFNSSYNNVAVWHFNDTPTFFDSTNTYSASDTGTVSGTRIGTSRKFDSSGDIITTNYAGYPTQISIISWYKIDAKTNLQRWFQKGPSTDQEVVVFYDADQTPHTLRFQVRTTGTTTDWYFDIESHVGNYIQLAVIQDLDTITNAPIVYINGVSATVNSLTSPTGSINIGSGVWTFGNRAGDFARALSGEMDEFRIYDTILSPDYIKLSYEAEKSDSNILTFEDYISPSEPKYNVYLATPGGVLRNKRSFAYKDNITGKNRFFNYR